MKKIFIKSWEVKGLKGFTVKNSAANMNLYEIQ